MAKRQEVYRSLTLGVGCAATLMPFMTSSAEPIAVPPEWVTPTLDEVIVTVRGREENIRDVPASLSAFERDAIDSFQIIAAGDLARVVPNLRVSTLVNEDVPKLSFRGIAASTFNITTAAPTGVFYDGVYIASQFLGGPQIFDMERVEVMRGPQGALFSQGSMGGAINFITRAPSPDSNGYLRAEAGDNAYRGAQGALNVPFGEKFAARLAFNFAQSDGWVENFNPKGDDLSSIDKYAIRLSLLGRSDEGGTAQLKLLHSVSNPTNIGVIAYGTGFTGRGTTNFFAVNPRVEPTSRTPFTSRQMFSNRENGELHADGDGAFLTLEQPIGGLVLKSTSSYVSGEYSNNVDSDGSVSDLLAIDQYADTTEISQDLQVSKFVEDRYSFVSGVSYWGDAADIRNDYRIYAGALICLQSYEQERSSLGAYFDGSLALGPAWQLYGGARWNKDEGELSRFQVLVTPASLTIPRQPTKEYSDSEPSGKLGVSLKLTPTMNAYAQVAHSFRNSNINGAALGSANELNIAGPESLDAFELGLKAQPSEYLRLHSSAFFYSLRDQQFLSMISLLDTGLVNAGKAHIYGLELEAIAQLEPQLRITLGVGLLRSEYQELMLSSRVGTALVANDLSGNEVTEAPEFSASLAIDYSISLGSLGGVLVHADGSYVGSQFYTPYNDRQNRLSQVGPQKDVNMRIEYRSASGKYGVSLWGKNLTDNDAAAGQLPADIGVFRDHYTVSPYPRRFGVGIDYQF